MRILILCLLITGCTTLKPDIKNTGFHLYFIESGHLYLDGRKVKALTYPGGNVCVIKMDMKYYSENCLGHELRHCLEGYWHGTDIVDCH